MESKSSHRPSGVKPHPPTSSSKPSGEGLMSMRGKTHQTLRSAVSGTRGTRQGGKPVDPRTRMAHDLRIPENRIPVQLTYVVEDALLGGDEEQRKREREKELEKEKERENQARRARRLAEAEQQDAKPAKKTWDDAELKRLVSVQLAETSTVTLLHLPAARVNLVDKQTHGEVQQRNRDYQDLLERRKDKDKYVSRQAQTITATTRTRESQTEPAATASAQTQATAWDIIDAFEAQQLDDQKRTRAVLASHATGGLLRGPGITGLSGAASSLGALAAATASGVFADAQSASAGSIDGGASGASSSLLRLPGGASAGQSSRTGRGDSFRHGGRGAGAAGAGEAGATAGDDAMRNEVLGLVPAEQYILSLPAFSRALRMMENAVVQPQVLAQQLLFRSSAHEGRIPHGLSSASGAFPAAAAVAGPGAAGASSSAAAAAAASGLRNPAGARAGAGAGGAAAGGPAASSGLGLLTDEERQLKLLWTFSSTATAGMQVTCMSWNHQNHDLLAVGYGHPTFANSAPGLIAFWSLLNPTYPQRVFKTKSSVTALEFAPDENQGHMLAAGMHDGSVAVYDVRDPSGRAALESVHPDKHSEAVWTVRWVHPAGPKRDLQLMTVSSDGTARQWLLKLGFKPHVLIELKRAPNRAQLGSGETQGSSREASGMCLDAPWDDPTQYYVGTEEGLIHKCSVSYNEQTLESYVAHTGPVYRVACSPFLPSLILSCSSDWTCLLWHHKRTSPLISPFQSGHDSVLDAAWAPNNSCLFASVQRSGRVDLWDLSYSAIEPLMTYRTTSAAAISSAASAAGGRSQTGPKAFGDRIPTCLGFARNASVLVVGCQDGTVQVLHTGVHSTFFPGDRQAQAARLAAAVSSHSDQATVTAQGALVLRHTLLAANDAANAGGAVAAGATGSTDQGAADSHTSSSFAGSVGV